MRMTLNSQIPNMSNNVQAHCLNEPHQKTLHLGSSRRQS